MKNYSEKECDSDHEYFSLFLLIIKFKTDNISFDF